jgi:hypothetical protein
MDCIASLQRNSFRNCGRSSQNTERRLQPTRTAKGRRNAALFGWLYRNGCCTRYGCSAHICRACGFSATAFCDDFTLYAQAT